MTKQEQTASEILEQIGGKQNVTFVAHCMTRLRFNLKDESKINQDTIKEIKGVLGCQFSGGQFQIIIGQTVEQVYKEICRLSDRQIEDQIEENLDKVKKPFSLKTLGNAIMDGMTGCLTPIIPVLICSGMVKMIVALIGPTMLSLVSDTSDVFRLLTFVGDAGFYFFPVFIGYSGAKKFGCNPFIAMLLGTILLHPTLTSIVAQGEAFHVFGIPMTLTSYSTSVFPMILATWIMSYIEKGLKRIIPDAVGIIFTPSFTLLLMLPITLCGVGPLGTILGVYVTNVLLWLHSTMGPLGIAIIAALWGPLVATGMHLPLIATAVTSMMTLGFDNTVLVGANLCVYSSIAISLAIFIKTRDKTMKGISASCLISQALGGVGEPTIFGIIMRYKKTLMYSLIGPFFGGLYAGFTNVAFYFLGASNLLSALSYGGGDATGLLNGCIAAGISFAITFGLVMVFGFEDKKKVS